ncbi:hypothetical protein HOK68_02840 [Candidatus Woesearchaeota archaeon]|nr:hypothetical protein [Candidatus Woesearchaeota archaeon]
MPGRKRNNFKKEFCSVVEYLKEPTNLLLVYNFEYGSLMAKSQWFKKTSKQ